MITTNSADHVPAHNPYFSVILPIYNVAPYLEQSIESVLKQAFQNYELILVDDGSTDSSPVICDDYAARYEHIRVVHKPNGGLSNARNAGTEIARGQYIWWVDSDDWIEPDALQILHEASREKNPDMVKFRFYRAGDQRQLVNCNAETGFYAEKSIEQLLNKGFFRPGSFSLSAWGHIYKREFLEAHKLSFVSERIIGSEDYLFNLYALAVAQSVQVIPNALYNYRLRLGSLTQRYRKELPEKYTELYRRLCEQFRRIGLLKQFQGRICRFYVWHLIHGTCLPNEYRITEDHSQKEGRRRIRMFFKDPDFLYATRHCDLQLLTGAHRIQVLAMRMGMEGLFYWLYVIKPRYKKVISHENQNKKQL